MTTLTRERPAWVPSELYPFADHYLEIDGCLVHYIREGSGPPLLLLHGNPFWSFTYRGIVRRLSGRFRCVAPDYPGFGLSRARPGYDFRPASHARIIEGLVDRLGLDGLTVMVHDWGGPIGLAVAGRHPERVRALVIGNTWAWPLGPEDRGLRIFSRLLGGPVLGRILVRHLNVFLNVFVERGYKRRKLTPLEMQAYRGPFPTPASREPIQVFPREIVGSAAFLAEVQERQRVLADRPVLILWADQDQGFGERELRRFEGLFPRHRTVVLRGVSHNQHDEAPEEIAAAIQAWWDEEVAQR